MALSVKDRRQALRGLKAEAAGTGLSKGRAAGALHRERTPVNPWRRAGTLVDMNSSVTPDCLRGIKIY